MPELGPLHLYSQHFKNPSPVIKVSVCIPTYNQALYLEKAIRSAAMQTWAPHEIIVSDDASTDETPELLVRLAQEIPALKIMRQPQNLGISLNVDRCLRAASGDFIVRLDSDDMLLPAYIERLASFIGTFPKAGYAHASVLEVDQYDRPVRARQLIRKSGYQSDVESLKAAISGYRVAANIIMFRREALEKAGYIKSNADFAEDYHLCASIAAQGYGNYYLDEILSNYRVWMDSGKVRQRRKLAEIKGLRQVFAEVLEPAYTGNERMLNLIKNQRSRVASIHADCLGWTEYTASEKEELSRAIDQLSSSYKVKAVKWLYLNGYGQVWSKAISLLNFPKQLLKLLILRWRDRKGNRRPVVQPFKSI